MPWPLRRKKRKRSSMKSLQMEAGAGWWCCIASSYVGLISTGTNNEISCKWVKWVVKFYFLFLPDVAIRGYGMKSFVCFLSAGKCSRDGNAEELRDLLCSFSRWVWRLGGEHQLDRLHHVQPASLWRFVLRTRYSGVGCVETDEYNPENLLFLVHSAPRLLSLRQGWNPGDLHHRGGPGQRRVPHKYFCQQCGVPLHQHGVDSR